MRVLPDESAQESPENWISQSGHYNSKSDQLAQKAHCSDIAQTDVWFMLKILLTEETGVLTMTSASALSAIEANRKFTHRKDAEARLSQAQRDLDARVISPEDYQQICEDCLKIIRSSQS